MFRELAVALADGEPSFGVLVKRLVPGSHRKNPDARYLRNYVAAVFAPVGVEQLDIVHGVRLLSLSAHAR